jgi:hypothetical protein
MPAPSFHPGGLIHTFSNSSLATVPWNFRLIRSPGPLFCPELLVHWVLSVLACDPSDEGKEGSSEASPGACGYPRKEEDQTKKFRSSLYTHTLPCFGSLVLHCLILSLFFTRNPPCLSSSLRSNLHERPSS